MTSIFKWLKRKLTSDDDDIYSLRPPIRVSAVPRRKKPPALPEKAQISQATDNFEYSTEGPDRIADGGPGKNILIRNRYLREDTGTHETLKILDDSVAESDEPVEFDPYNTGRFDRSKTWDAPTRKK